MGQVNWRGLWNLYVRETRRFLTIPAQSLLAPLASTLLFYHVFNIALEREGTTILNVDFNDFLIPGLIMMAIMQNAFANASFSLVIAKVQGSIVDSIMPPLTPFELAVGYSLGGVSRGIAVGGVTLLGMMPFFPHVSFALPAYILFYGLSAAFMLATIGVICGVLAYKFDHLAALTNFVVTPMTFLSGTFYVIEQFPPAIHQLMSYNPCFHLIDGFRYGFISHADGMPFSLAVILSITLINIGLLLVAWLLIKKGVGLTQ